MAKLYECRNANCPLGPLGLPGGLFTGGMIRENANVLGLPQDHPVGPGICPNCGEKAEEYDSVYHEKLGLKDAKDQYEEQVKLIKKGRG